MVDDDGLDEERLQHEVTAMLRLHRIARKFAQSALHFADHAQGHARLGEFEAAVSNLAESIRFLVWCVADDADVRDQSDPDEIIGPHGAWIECQYCEAKGTGSVTTELHGHQEADRQAERVRRNAAQYRWFAEHPPSDDDDEPPRTGDAAPWRPSR